MEDDPSGTTCWICFKRSSASHSRRSLGNPDRIGWTRLWFAPKESPRGSWTNQAQFVLARSITEKKLRYGLSIECAPLSDSEKTGGSVDRDGRRLLSQLNNQDFRDQIDELLTQEGWTILARNWENDQHYDGKSLSQAMGLLDTVQKDQGWEVCIWKSLSAEAAIAAGEEISEQIADAFLEVRPLWEAIIPEADREYLSGNKTPDPRLIHHHHPISVYEHF